MSRATKPLDALVSEELAAIPRREFYQNLYRMVYEQARLNGLGRRAEIAPIAVVAHDFALRLVREQQPDFIPELLG